jgi:hypothetical protein
LAEIKMSDNIPVTSGGAEILTKDFSVAVRVVDTRM